MKKLFLFFATVLWLAGGQKEYIVGFAQDTMANDWRIAQVKEAEAAFKAFGDIRFYHTDAKGKTSLQIKNIEDMVQRGVDLLMVSPRDSKVMAPVIASVYRQGIPVVLLSRSVESLEYTSFVHASDRKIAEEAARYMIKKLGGKGRVLMLTGVESASTAKERTAGFLEEAATAPGIEIVTRTGNYLRGDAIKVTEELIYAGERFDALFAQSDSMAVGAIMALEKYGVDVKKMVIVGIDYIAEARELIREGRMDATFTYPTVGQEGAKIAAKILHGKKVPKELIVESHRVTRKNVETTEPIF